MELRIASDRDLVNCYKSLQQLNEDCEKLQAQLKELEEAALPIARLLVHSRRCAPPVELVSD
jgi:DNA repair ATPase RecN